MKVKELIELLKKLDQEKRIQIVETFSYYDISEEIDEDNINGVDTYLIELKPTSNHDQSS